MPHTTAPVSTATSTRPPARTERSGGHRFTSHGATGNPDPLRTWTSYKRDSDLLGSARFGQSPAQCTGPGPRGAAESEGTAAGDQVKIARLDDIVVIPLLRVVNR